MIPLFCLFTVGGMLIHFRPSAHGGVWDFIFLVCGIICCGIFVSQAAGIPLPRFRSKS